MIPSTGKQYRIKVYPGFLRVYVLLLAGSLSLNVLFMYNYSSSSEQLWQKGITVRGARSITSMTDREKLRKTNSATPTKMTADAVLHESKTKLPMARSSPDDSKGSFAACLLVMDENHKLPEWLAYHYHVLPLEYLVVAVDPFSHSSPDSILKQWRNWTGMTILEWNDTNVYDGKLDLYDSLVKGRRAVEDHRRRQNMFVRNCLAHMKQVGRNWVMVTDTDEYLLFNGPKGAISSSVHGNIPYPGLNDGHGGGPSGSIMNFLKSEVQRPGSNYTNATCISIPRLLFGAMESNTTEVNYKVPLGIDAKKIQTLRFRKHFRRSIAWNSALNGWSKVIVDVSKIRWEDLPTVDDAFRTASNMLSIHQPLPNLCPRPFIQDHETLFRINHYLGSWEDFSARSQDARSSNGRNYDFWHRKATIAAETDDNIRDWISGFVDENGMEFASKAKDLV